jgi:hypothetical protein
VNYEETLLHLDSVAGSYAIVYPASADSDRTEVARAVTAPGGILASGVFKRDLKTEQAGAKARRGLVTETDWFRHKVPSVDRGDLPLEEYERQAAFFTFEGLEDMVTGTWSNDAPGYAGFSLWRESFVESDWLELPVAPDWLWIRSNEAALVVVADFPNGPRLGSTG